MGDAFGKDEDGSVRQDVLLPISSRPFTTFPNPSTCHRCGLRLIGRIQTFYSQWRIVLLCRECFARIRSAQLCSYCFSLFPESEDSFLDCFLCFRRVHRACVPLHHRNFSHSQLDAVKFFCIDCRPIPKLRGKYPKTSGCSASHATFMAPLISGAKSISEKKVALHAKPKENVTKEKMVGMEFGSREFGAIQLVMEPSNTNLSVSNEKMSVLLHHQPINESEKISRSLFPGKEQCSCDADLKTVDSDSCAHHSKIEDSTRNKSLPEDSLFSEAMLASCPLFNTACIEDLILKETETSIKFLDSIDDGGSSSSEMLPCHSLNTRLNNAKAGDCDGESSPKLQRKSIEAAGQDWSMKKYFRKRWSSGRIIHTNSQSILSNSRLCDPESLDMMKQTSVCSIDSPKNFSLQEKEGSLWFLDSMYAGSNGASASLPCHGMNTWSNSTMPLINCKFGDGGEGSSIIQQSSIHARYSHRTLNNCDAVLSTLDSDSYAHHSKIEDSTRNKFLPEDNLYTESMLASCPLFNTACLEDLILKETETSIKFLDSIDDGGYSSSEMLPCHSFNTRFSNAKPGDCDGEGSPKLQRKRIEAVGQDWSMKKYFRKRWSSGRIIQMNSQSILSNSRLCEPENLDMMKQTSVCSADSPKNFSLQEKEGSLRFPDSMYDGSNDGEGSPKLQRKSIEAIGLDCSLKKYFRKRRSSGGIIQTNSQSNLSNSRFCEPENLDVMKQTTVCSTDSPKNFSLQEKEVSLWFPDSMYAGSNDGEGLPKLQRKSIETVGLDCSMKKYFRKRWSSGRIIQTNSQSILSNSRFCEPKKLDVMKQTSACSAYSPKNFSLREKEGSLRFPDSMYAGSNVASASLPCHGMNTWSNSTMTLINCKYGDGDGEGSSAIQRSSIHARYSHRTRGSGGIVQGKTESILTNGPLFNQNRESCRASSGDFFLKEESPLKFQDCTDNGSNAGCALLPSYSLNDWSYRAVPITKYMFDVGDVDGPSKMQPTSNAKGYRPLKKYFRKNRGSGRIMQKGILNEI
ncbi:hypothetical protein KSP40_PGU021293 [Platanthera guangdongensis]|uniref:Uncharacterized protein n=1 Tax=Platanthera guangdongensis TaxID=2320717 RepID=A0ABR2MS44_9ASPA